VRNLTPDEAASGHRVRIRGVITDDVPSPDFFVQDSTAGVYVEGARPANFIHHFGDLVEVEGVTGPGKFAPVVKEISYRVLGKGALPKTRIYSFSELADGQLDSQWVRVRGIVRTVSIDRTSWRETTVAIRIASGGGQLNVRIPIPAEQDFSSWIDSEVLVEGVCGSLFNTQRQLTAILLYVPRLSFVTFESHARAMPLSSLLTFDPGLGDRHRVRVRGVVGYQQPGKALFLQGEGRALRVLTEQDTKVNVGDVVDAVGFDELANRVMPKREASPSEGGVKAGALGVGVGPQQIGHGALQGNLLESVEHPDLVHRVDVGCQPSMDTEDRLVNQASKG